MANHFIDTIRMIAYRAETAMLPLITDPHTDFTAARAILQALFRSPADIRPEPQHNRLRIQLHRACRPATDGRLARLCEQLNQAEMVYPGTDLTLTYELISAPTVKNGVTITSPR